MSKFLKFSLLPAAVGLLMGCESIDCTLNNVVLCHYSFANHLGQDISFGGQLTITAEGTDSVLINRLTNAKGFSLPMSYVNDADTLVLTLQDGDSQFQTRIYIEKQNTPHFESPDCPAVMFHHITAVGCDADGIVDSLTITKASVNYQSDENVKIYFHTAD
ncbi:MAG: hypothetical protein HUK02_10330 [Bacteroidaceae bacterium]|nr:hypothetical protein [Bacteroidaceae bacterium]